MLDELEVKDVALIQKANLEFCEGLTVITGETGAGKTALLNAVKMLVGERSDKGLVRQGARELCVTGRFYQKEAGTSESQIQELVDESSVQDEASPEACTYDEDGYLVVQRRITAEGKSRVSLNGSLASVGELATYVAPSLDLCGQHENQLLLKPAYHASLLDSWASTVVSPCLVAYKDAYRAYLSAKKELARILEAQSAGEAKLQEARFVLDRIDAVNPVPGEYEELLETLHRAQHAEALATATFSAQDNLSCDDGVLDKITNALIALEAVRKYDPSLETHIESMRGASCALEDVSRFLSSYARGIDFDPQQIEEWQNRVSSMQGLMRSYGPTMEEVFKVRARAAETVSLITNASDALDEAQKTYDAAEALLVEKGNALYEARTEAAPQFQSEVSGYMAQLEMGSASLVCRVALLPQSQWGSAGSCSVEFLYKPASGLDAQPLSKIASGGEMSRVMLAIKVVLGNADKVDTLIFDEIDAGVGGATALAIAAVLRQLAQTHQVILVTHLAQIAVQGSKHYVVSKSSDNTSDGIPVTSFTLVEGQSRVQEIARMLSGELTDTSLTHAAELLADVQ